MTAHSAHCNTFALCPLRTWNIRADLMKEVMDMVAHQDVSWASEGGTKRLVRLPMSLIRAWAWAPKEPKFMKSQMWLVSCERRGGASGMVQNSREGRQSPGLGAGEEQFWRSYRHRRQLLDLQSWCRRWWTSGEHPNRPEPNLESWGGRHLRVGERTSSVYETPDTRLSCGSHSVRGWSRARP